MNQNYEGTIAILQTAEGENHFPITTVDAIIGTDYNLKTKISELSRHVDSQKVTNTNIQTQIQSFGTALDGKSNTSHQHSYEELTNKPSIPTKVSELALDTVYTKSEVDERLANLSTGGSVDLSNYPTKAELQTAIEEIELIPGPKGDQGIPGEPGQPGRDGAPGSAGEAGRDGREVEITKSSTHIQWRYAGEGDWLDLVAVSDLKGDKGDTGLPGTTSWNDLEDKPTIPSIEGLATETFVTDKIAEAQLDGGNVDLSDYATKAYVDEAIQASLGAQVVTISQTEYNALTPEEKADPTKLYAIMDSESEYVTKLTITTLMERIAELENKYTSLESRIAALEPSVVII